MGPSLKSSEERGRGEVRTLASYAAEWQRGADAFRARYPCAVLLYKQAQEGDEAEPAFQTAHGAMMFTGSMPLRARPGPIPGPGDVLVYPVLKRPDGIFQERISVGRTRNTDICVPSPKVSKLHAYFTIVAGAPDQAARYLLSDAGSTNGTFVNGERLLQDHPAALGDEDVIQFGKLTLRFYLPAGFYRLLGQQGGSRNAP